MPARDAIVAPATRWKTRCEIWDLLSNSIWMADARVVDGQVSMSLDRPEQRNIDIVLDNTDGSLTPNPNGGMWYNRFLMPWKQILDSSGGVLYEIPLGCFMPDGFSADHFPNLLRVTGRDFNKKLTQGTVGRTHTYFKGTPFGEAVEDLTRWAQIPASRVFWSGEGSDPTAVYGNALKKRFVFERGAISYYEALDQMAKSFNGTSYFMFNAWGLMRARRHRDILSDPPIARFDVGPGGNLVKYAKSADDSMIKNHIIVINEGTNETELFVGRAWNNSSGHPTSRQRIGERARTIRVNSLTSNQECIDYAVEVLSVSALEAFSVSFDSLVMPWPDLGPGQYAYLDVNNVMQFYDGSGTENFSLTDLTIPLRIGRMTGTMKRLTNIPIEVVSTGT